MSVLTLVRHGQALHEPGRHEFSVDILAPAHFHVMRQAHAHIDQVALQHGTDAGWLGHDARLLLTASTDGERHLAPRVVVATGGAHQRQHRTALRYAQIQIHIRFRAGGNLDQRG